MQSNSRKKTFERLKNAPASPSPGPVQQKTGPLRETTIDKTALTEAFCSKFTENTGIVYRHDPKEDIGAFLSHIFQEHEISTAIASNDKVLVSTEILKLADKHGLDIKTQTGFANRGDFTDAIFEDADAGLTGVDFGVAESGTLVLAFNSDHARLLSLAPDIHIAVLPENRIVAVYEQAVEIIYKNKKAPSQAIFITGPSMTGDIQGVPFKGMHGPRKLIVILV